APEAGRDAELLTAQGRTVTVGSAPPTAMDVLSPRARGGLPPLAKGLSNPAIAQRLVISPKTVEHPVSNILSKLGLRNRAEAAAFAASFRIYQDQWTSSAD